MTDAPILIREDDGPIATLTMNAPKSLNALSEAMLDAMAESLDALADDTSIRVVILRGAGRAFCAGHDLREMTEARQSEDGGQEYFQALFAKCSSVMMRLPKLPKPVIAQVHGIAAAAGCQLVAHCDLAVADEDARFGVNGVNIGLFCSTPMVALSRNMARKHVFELLTTGSFLSAHRAAELGLVNRVASEAELDAATRELAQTIAGKLGRAVAIGKRAFYDQLEMGLPDAYAYTSDVMAENMLYEQTEEGIAAFLEKRDPRWSQ